MIYDRIYSRQENVALRLEFSRLQKRQEADNSCVISAM